VSADDLAVVTEVKRVRHYDKARTEADIVYLTYDGKLYAWETEPGVYGVGHKVSVNPPEGEAGNITWKGDIGNRTGDRDTMTEASRTEFGSRDALLANQDECLLAIEDGNPVPVARLRALPPWRAVMLARIAAKAGVPLERGTVDQIQAEAREVGGAGALGPWWERPDTAGDETP
jgi:hypothetical protein